MKKYKIYKDVKYKCTNCKKYVHEDLITLNDVVCSKCGKNTLLFEKSKKRWKIRKKVKYIIDLDNVKKDKWI